MDAKVTPAPLGQKSSVEFQDSMTVDGYIKNVADQDAENKKLVQVAQEALANPYQPAAPVAPVQPAPQPSVSAPAPTSESSGYTMDPGKMLAAATPLLVDFLMGGNQGTGISADAYIKQATPEKKDLSLAIEESKLRREQERTRRAMASGAGSKADKLVKVNENGKPVYKYSSEAAGKEAYQPANEGMAFDPQEYYDQEQGVYKLGAFDNKTGTYVRNPSDPVSTRRNPVSDFWATTGTLGREKLAVDKVKAQAAKMKAEKAIQGLDFKSEKELYDKRNTDPTTRGTLEMARNFDAIQKAGRRWAEDPASRAVTEQELVVAYLKSIDPGSVARESEQLGVVNAKGALDMLYSYPDRIKLGQKLTPPQVRGLLDSSKQRWQSQNATQDGIDTAYQQRAKKFGFSLDSLNRPKVAEDNYDYLSKVSDSASNSGRVLVKVNGQEGYMTKKEYEEQKKDFPDMELINE